MTKVPAPFAFRSAGDRLLLESRGFDPNLLAKLALQRAARRIEAGCCPSCDERIALCNCGFVASIRSGGQANG